MTISHGGYTSNSISSQHAPPQYPKNQMIGGHTQQKRPQPTNQPSYSSQSNTQNAAWRALDINTTKGGSQQHQRAKFGGSQMQMRDSQFGTIVHPSIIKTNNLMMESIGSTKDQKKMNLNNTTIQPISSHLAYGSNVKNDKSPMNTRNWRNKSIDTTPDNDHYAYPVGKRTGSTANGERQHNTIVVASSNPSKLI
jgi:hypothetical protein